jgi:hypothetical protein
MLQKVTYSQKSEAVAGMTPPELVASSAAVGSESASATSVSGSVSSQESFPGNKRAYPAPAEVPTQEGPKAVRFDFNDGCRVALPEGEHSWRVRLSDLDTGNILYETEIKAGRVNSSKRYFVRFRLDVWTQGASLFSHDARPGHRRAGGA